MGKRGENSLVVSENENFNYEENWVKLVFVSTKKNYD